MYVCVSVCVSESVEKKPISIYYRLQMVYFIGSDRCLIRGPLFMSIPLVSALRLGRQHVTGSWCVRMLMVMIAPNMYADVIGLSGWKSHQNDGDESMNTTR